MSRIRVSARCALAFVLAAASCTRAPLDPARDTSVRVSVGPTVLTGPEAVDPGADLVVSNEHLRLSLLRTADSASLRVEMMGADGEWVTVTGPRYGDWLYYGTTPTRRATAVEVIANTAEEVAVRWTFANHRIPARYGNPAYAYPFERTIWLRRGERGYYSHTRPLATPSHSYDTEHEVGWGGLYGAGTIASRDVSVRTEDIVGDLRFNGAGAVDAVDFRWDEDGLRRVLVPLPGAEFQAPRFSDDNYGGVYVHAVGVARSYGAYLYVAPPGDAEPARSVCAFAWRNAPFQLPAVTDEQLAACGPNP